MKYSRKKPANQLDTKKSIHDWSQRERAGTAHSLFSEIKKKTEGKKTRRKVFEDSILFRYSGS